MNRMDVQRFMSSCSPFRSRHFCLWMFRTDVLLWRNKCGMIQTFPLFSYTPGCLLGDHMVHLPREM